MRKRPEGRATLTEQFDGLDAVQMPPELPRRLRLSLPAADREPRRGRSVAWLVTAALAAFALGRLSVASPAAVAVPTAAPSPVAVPTTGPSPVASPAVSRPELLAVTRDGELLVLRVASAGASDQEVAAARLRLPDGATLLPESFDRDEPSVVALRYRVPSRFGFSNQEASLELGLGSGTWVQRIPLK